MFSRGVFSRGKSPSSQRQRLSIALVHQRNHDERSVSTDSIIPALRGMNVLLIGSLEWNAAIARSVRTTTDMDH